MENANLYLIILLAGILIGGAVVISLLIGLMRPPAWGFPPPYYANYGAEPAQGGSGFFLLLLVLGVFALMLMHSAQGQRNRLPAAQEIPVQQPYHRYDGSGYADWGN